ncbi:MAG: hypothetical protein KIH69_015050 [Anaerolineae bacterium]|nr:hypothetical protein [Anaerolineae bacterium]
MAKAVMSWNIKEKDNSTYFEFVVQDLLPNLMRIGLRPTQAWFTMWGNGPQIITTIESADGDLDMLRETLKGEDWFAIRERLMVHVTDFKQRISSSD